MTCRGSTGAPCHGHTAHLSQKWMAERETVESWMSWPSTSCNKAPQERPSQWGEEVSKQQPAVACTFSYWLSLYSEPLCGCQIPYSNLSAERGPLPWLVISIFPLCLKLLSPPSKEVSICSCWRCLNEIAATLSFTAVSGKLLNSLAIMGVLP